MDIRLFITGLQNLLCHLSPCRCLYPFSRCELDCQRSFPFQFCRGHCNKTAFPDRIFHVCPQLPTPVHLEQCITFRVHKLSHFLPQFFYQLLIIHTLFSSSPVTQSCVSFYNRSSVYFPIAHFSVPIVLHLFPIFMPTIKRPDHRAFYSYHKLAGTTFPIYLLPFLPQPYSYRISCSMTMPDWNCISSFSLDSTLMVEISRLTRSLSNSGIWQVLVLK